MRKMAVIGLGQRDLIEVPVDRGVHPGIMLGVLAWHQFSAPNRFGSLNHARFGQWRDTSYWKIRQAFPRTDGNCQASARTGSRRVLHRNEQELPVRGPTR